ncbi:MAG: hypothetical protein SP1CHLAM54_14840 [Chlamydiia bacterium]|nr:hypothetical protein [Chlamydiia bacterium]MCH9616374.1 hypothetical protein [Chlamydiia bacterium]MCH9629640.1 hypothetical protein [Chlamydiia bacterium]
MSNIWKLLLGVAFLSCVWTGGKFAYELYKYFDYDCSSLAVMEKWEVLSLNEDKYAVQAIYAFNSPKGKQYASYIFKKPYFKNPTSAESNLKHWKGLNWRVWYKKNHPERSTLQRLFPFKAAIHAALSLGVCFYFTYLFGYSRRFTST